MLSAGTTSRTRREIPNRKKRGAATYDSGTPAWSCIQKKVGNSPRSTYTPIRPVIA